MLVLCITALVILEAIIIACLLIIAKKIMKTTETIHKKPLQKSCTNCKNFKECQLKNTSFEFAEYGNDWVNWCEKF